MNYSVPGGHSLGEVLGLRHGHAAGISTRQNVDGTWELTGWPAGLGAVPTQGDVNNWAGEVATRRTVEKRERAKAGLRENDPDTVKLRASLRVVMTSLVETRNTLNSIVAACKDATSLADLKSRAAAVAVLTNRTWPQVLAAVDAIVDAGQGEE